MNNNIENVVTGSNNNNIYISEHSESDIKYLPLGITDGNTPINQINLPFHLSKSNQYRAEAGFTGRIMGEVIKYSKIETLTDFLNSVRLDVSGSLFKEHIRGSRNGEFISSDVLVFDIDNYDPQKPDLFNNRALHLTIDRFTEMFKDYEFLITTSVNHQKQKKDQAPRDKYHVFMSLGKEISEDDEYKELLDKTDYLIKTKIHDYDKIKVGSDDDYSMIDGAIGLHSQIWGNTDTTIYYNKGSGINDSLHKTDFCDDYRRYRDNFGKYRNKQHKENKTVIGDYESNQDNYLSDWDSANIMSRVLNEIYRISYKVGHGYYVGYCDLHDDKNPSLMIFPNGGYKCLAGCGHSLNGLDYVAKKENKERWEVREHYCNELNLDVDEYWRWFENDRFKKIESDPNYVDYYNEKFNINFSGTLRVDAKVYKRLKDMNKEYAVIQTEGDVHILHHTLSTYSEFDLDGNEFDGQGLRLVPQTFNHFLKAFGNQDVFVEKRGKKKTDDELKDEEEKNNGTKIIDKHHWEFKVHKNIGQLWSEWRHRREYDGGTFYPNEIRKDYSHIYSGKRMWDYYDDWASATEENNWVGADNRRGLVRFLKRDILNKIESEGQAIEMCNLYLNHIKDRICGHYKGKTHEDLLNYILLWMSSCLFQHTHNRTTTSLILCGGQGTGKGVFASWFGELFGGSQHYFYHVTNSQYMTKQFNKLMENRLLVFGDETLFVGDKRDQQILKTMQTEKSQQIEPKNINAYIAPNFRRFIFASNFEVAIYKEKDDRRNQVLEVKEGRLEKSEVRPIRKQWENGGKEALFYYLTQEHMKERARKFDFEKLLKTEAGHMQELESEVELGWFHEVLMDGGHQGQNMNDRAWNLIKWEDSDDENQFPIESLWNAFTRYLETVGGSGYAGSKQSFARALKKLKNNGVIFEDVRRHIGGAKLKVYKFEGLRKVRQRYIEANGLDKGYFGDESSPITFE